MLRTSTSQNFGLYIDEFVSRAADSGSAEESFGDGDGYGFYALVDIPSGEYLLDLIDDEREFLESHPWAILNQDSYNRVDVTYYHSERAARDDWFLHQLSYDQYMAEVEKDK